MGEKKEDKTKLDGLDRRITEAKSKHERPENYSGRGTAMGLAFRLATELVAGLIVGGGIGWFLDHWLGTSPLMLLVFFLLGAVAGILNVFRTANQIKSNWHASEN